MAYKSSYTGPQIDKAVGIALDIESDLASIHATGSTNTTGAAIPATTYFYLDGVLVKALADIAVNATFTLNTNYAAVTAGGLNELGAVTDVSSEFTKVNPSWSGNWYAKKCGHIISLAVWGGNNSVAANTEKKYLTFSNAIKPAGLSITEYYVTNEPLSAKSGYGIRIKPDGVYLANGDSSAHNYFQGIITFINEA